MTDLFDKVAREQLWREAPLAERMRPRSIEEMVGQEQLVGQGRVLRQAIEQDRLFSLILWGPPGCGKTTLARIIAASTKSAFVQISAVTEGIPALKKIIADAEDRRKLRGQRTVLFLDEIHRWNKAQQDGLLPFVESGAITLIGATTKNPSFEVISPLLSRSRVFVLHGLDETALRELVLRALTDAERGLGKKDSMLEGDALRFLVQQANGDARAALNTLELASQIAAGSAITLERVREALQHAALLFDKHGEEHYNTISALIKSIRGSDPNAGLYWLARLLAAGEDPKFVARRLVILASEDVGNADPMGLVVAAAAAQAVEYVGLPEAQLNLAQAVTYLATAPKSNASYVGLQEAQADVARTLNLPVPLHLRNAVTKLMGNLGYGKGYKYSHDHDAEEGKQQYLPDELKDKRYYRPQRKK